MAVDITTILTLIVALGGLSGVAGIITALTAARKSDIEGLQITIRSLTDENARLRMRLDEIEADLDAAQKLLEENRLQLVRYETEVKRLRARVSELERENRRLKEDIKPEGE